MTLDYAADYIIMKMDEAREPLNALKLQKLVYYVQAWYLAFYGKTMFPGRFQAWVHGPVNRELYDRFSPTKSLYSVVGVSDMRPGFNPDQIPQPMRSHINAVLGEYASLTGDQLEEMTHSEEPWSRARYGYAPHQRCEVEIDESVMAQFYKARGEAA